MTMETTSLVLDDTPVVLSPNPLPNPDLTPPTPSPATNTDDPNAYVEKLFHNWAKNSHLAFLNNHLSTYCKHVNQGKSQATDYVYEVMQEYFQHYHWKMKISDEPSENNPLQMESDESLSPIELKQKLQKILVMQKAIKSWLDYHAKSLKKLIWHKVGLPSSKMVTFHDRITHKHFKKLSEEEQKHWRDTAQAKGEAAVKEWSDHLAVPPSTSSIDRQVTQLGLWITSHLCWADSCWTLAYTRVSGPEPCKQGKITIVSMHEGIDLSPQPHNWQTRDKTKFKMVTKSFQKYLSHTYTKQDCNSCCLLDNLDSLFTIPQEGNQSDTEEEHEANELTTAKYRPWKKLKQQGKKQDVLLGARLLRLLSSMDSEDKRQGSRWVLPFSPPKANQDVTYFNPHHQKTAQKHLEAMKKGCLVNMPSPASEIPDCLSKVLSCVSEVPDDMEEIDQLDEDSSIINGITSAAIIEPPAAPFDDNLIDPHLRDDLGMAVNQLPASPGITSATIIEPPAALFNDNLIDPHIRDDPVMAVNQLPKPINNYDMDETPSAKQDTEGAVDDHDNPLNTTLDKHVVNLNRVMDSM
ncbi:uncharacterized protein BJ212DRAFT_1296388 [Suillus subaureus]|uniref:Uncharacterized protein n=1 Tax=Suillus subaureus TaxID=48587 RepID=A0A9P7JIG6_9AGAM|nr:uncharacterized protein BJ212DRAFT_1296388 [Suillus subaureus]KAG1823861.1 hypothetical protein BJ212DRAFT_1296388 [Suillus subaureus]